MKIFLAEWLLDNTLDNISEKNPILWGIHILLLVLEKFIKDKKKNEWVGFCSYRELWGKKIKITMIEIYSIPRILPKEWKDYEVIIGQPTILKKVKWIKLIKYGKLALFKKL